MSLDTYNLLIGLSALGMQIFAAAFLVLYFIEKRFADLRSIGDTLARFGLWIGVFLTLGATVFSLVHSQVFGLPPCDLCWWQRIFLYPQAVLFAIALWRRDVSVVLYSMALTVIGLCFAIYHHTLQMMPSGSLPCPSTGPSCSQILFLEFGYITYPMLSVSIFALLFVVMLFVRRRA